MKIKRTILTISLLLAAVFTLSANGSSESTATSSSATKTTTAVESNLESALMSADDLFSNRDLKQSADLSDATYITVESGKDITITEAGVYVFSGSAENMSIIVEATSDDKVQIVLDGVTIKNKNFPCIYVKQADKVFVTTTDSVNSLSVTGSFTSDGSTNTDAVIFSKDDLTLNGTGTLNISSSDNGISCKDDLCITGGTISISCKSDAVEAGDSIRIAGGDIAISSQKDGLHAENSDDDTTGFVYIGGGSLNISASDDGIHAITTVQIDDGNITVSAREGIEATYVQINGGTITINASDDGINAGKKSKSLTPTIEINGGYITIKMASGDTDGIDSNGNLYITGGTIDVTCNSPFDYDGTGSYTGGTLIVNGVQTNTLTNQMMGGQGGMGGRGGFIRF
ncbi:MAG: carbohydrate-binding domain-containing protein [bacterium]|nr:carbohydrate-binding domain-containing protein [bacterium]